MVIKLKDEEIAKLKAAEQEQQAHNESVIK